MTVTACPAVELRRTKKKLRKPFEIILRGRMQTTAEGRPFVHIDPIKAFTEALACKDFPAAEPLIEWSGKEQIAVLDLDYHGVPAPSALDLGRLAIAVRPEPSYWWVSHGSGLKLVYSANKPLSAEDQAAIARMILRQELHVRASGFEIDSRTRHPAYPRGIERCGDVHRGTGAGLAEARRLLLGDIDPAFAADNDRVTEWLDENGLQLGRRYPHSRCIIKPNETANGVPVWVSDAGLYCHRCAAKGVCYPGLSRPGFVPFQILIDGEPARIVNHLRVAVRNLTHWQHARHFIEDELAYRSLLKLWHLRGETADSAVAGFVDRVFFPPIPIVRSNDTWIRSTDFSPVGHSSLEIFLRQLPALQFAEVNGEKVKTGVSPVKLAKFMDGFDLTSEGYPNINILRGVDIAARARSLNDEGIYALALANPAFRYRRREERDMEAVAAHFERCFPGLNLALLKLLIAAKGVLQRGGNPEIPRVFIVGQSGASKSTTARLAANITGEVEAECGSGGDREKFVRGYADASMRATFALFNEVSKAGLSDSEIRGRFLSLERGMQYHAMYAGTACIRTPAAIVLTDCVLPSVFRNDSQLGRRFVLVDLGAGANETGQDWFDTCESGSIQQWRNHPYSMRANADAADCLVSEVIDEFFSVEGGPTFAEIARELGFPLIRSADGGEDTELREFFDAVQKLPEETDGHFAARGIGWRKFHKDNRLKVTADVQDRFRELTNGGTDYQRMHGANWSKITGIPGMRLSTRTHRAWIGLRFWEPKQGANGSIEDS